MTFSLKSSVTWTTGRGCLASLLQNSLKKFFLKSVPRFNCCFAHVCVCNVRVPMYIWHMHHGNPRHPWCARSTIGPRSHVEHSHASHYSRQRLAACACGILHLGQSDDRCCCCSCSPAPLRVRAASPRAISRTPSEPRAAVGNERTLCTGQRRRKITGRQSSQARSRTRRKQTADLRRERTHKQVET